MKAQPAARSSHAQYNHYIRHARFPDCHLARGALGRAFDRDGIWDTRWPCCLRRLLRHRRDNGPSRSMSGTATPLAGRKIGILAKNDSDTHDGDSGDSIENFFGDDHAVNQCLVGGVRERVA